MKLHKHSSKAGTQMNVTSELTDLYVHAIPNLKKTQLIGGEHASCHSDHLGDSKCFI